jgi:hypothetical protein
MKNEILKPTIRLILKATKVIKDKKKYDRKKKHKKEEE